MKRFANQQAKSELQQIKKAMRTSNFMHTNLQKGEKKTNDIDVFFSDFQQN